MNITGNITRRLLHKTILIFILLVLVLPTLLLGAVWLMIDPNDYKDSIATLLGKQINQTVKIEGPLSWGLRPLGFQVKNISLLNPPGFESPTLLSAKTATLSVSLLPLLRQKIDIHAIDLEDLAVYLEENTVHQNNWSHGVQTPITPITPITPPTHPVFSESAPLSSTLQTPTPEPPQALQLQIQTITLRNGLLSFKTPTEQVRIEHLEFSAKNIAPGTPTKTPIDFSLILQEPRKEQTAAVACHLSLALPAFTHPIVDIQQCQLTISQKNQVAPARFEIQTQFDLDLNARTLDLQKLSGEFNHLRFNGALKADLNDKAPSASGSITLQDSDMTALFQSLGYTTTPKTMQQLQAEVHFSTQANQTLAIQPITLTLDNHPIQGEILIQTHQQPYPLSFKITAPQIDLNQFPHPIDSPSSNTHKTNSNSPSQNALIPPQLIDILQQLDLTGEIQIKQLLTEKTPIDNVQLKIRAIDSILTINPIDADLYGGHFHASNQLDTRAKPMRIHQTFELQNVALRPLLQSKAQIDTVSGQCFASGALQSQGNTLEAILHSLMGSLHVKMQQAAIQGFDIEQLWLAAQAKKPDQNVLGSLGSTHAGNTTVFSEISANATLQQGIVSNPDLILKNPRFYIQGAGQINLPAEQIAYQLQLRENQQNQQNQMQVPFRLTGPLLHPSITLDWEALLKAQSTNVIQKQLNRFLKINPDPNTQTTQNPQDNDTTNQKLIEQTLDKLFAH